MCVCERVHMCVRIVYKTVPVFFTDMLKNWHCFMHYSYSGQSIFFFVWNSIYTTSQSFSHTSFCVDVQRTTTPSVQPRVEPQELPRPPYSLGWSHKTTLVGGTIRTNTWFPYMELEYRPHQGRQEETTWRARTHFQRFSWPASADFGDMCCYSSW